MKGTWAWMFSSGAICRRGRRAEFMQSCFQRFAYSVRRRFASCDGGPASSLDSLSTGLPGYRFLPCAPVQEARGKILLSQQCLQNKAVPTTRIKHWLMRPDPEYWQLVLPGVDSSGIEFFVPDSTPVHICQAYSSHSCCPTCA